MLKRNIVLLVVVMAALLIAFNPWKTQPEQTGTILDYSPHSLTLTDFECKDACKNTLVVANGERLINNCSTCTEVLLWANIDGEGKNLLIAGYEVTNGLQRSLETQTLPLKEHQNWQNETFAVSTSGAALKVTLQDGEWNLVENIICDKTCSGMRVGTYGKVFFDTCPPQPCTKLEISHGGYDDDYSIRVEQQPGVFAANNSPISLYDKTYSLKDQPTPGAISFDEVMAEHRITFTLSGI